VGTATDDELRDMRNTTVRVDPFGLGALVAAGTLSAHQIGYLTDADARAAHTYLSVIGPAILLIGFAAAWAAALRILRHDSGRAPSWSTLTAIQVSLFAAMEVGEWVALDSFGSLWSTPVIVGLCAQPVVAFAALRLLRVGQRVVTSYSGSIAVFDERSDDVAPAEPASVVLVERGVVLRLRGPPVG
jgi:hypothetical protein